jgi:hypothetical protein
MVISVVVGSSLTNANGSLLAHADLVHHPGGSFSFLKLGCIARRSSKSATHILCGRRRRAGNFICHARRTIASDRYRLARQ